MANDATWDFASLSIVYGGVLLTGFADGDSYTMTHDVDRYTRLVGNYGLGAWAKSNSFAAGGTLTLLATSDNNAAMQEFLTADENTPNGILVPLVALQLNGIFSHAGSFRIIKAPDVSRGPSVPTTTWMIGTTRLIQVLGGQTPPDIVTSVAQAREIIAAATPLPRPV